MKYKVENLSSKTPGTEQSKLIDAVKVLEGVDRAMLHLNSNEIELVCKDKKGPDRRKVADAATSAGFTLSSQ